MFVLAGALDRAPRHLNLEDRIGYMMKTAGTSITLTSLTGRRIPPPRCCASHHVAAFPTPHVWL